MRRFSIVKGALTVGLTVVCIGALVGCSESTTSDSSESETSTSSETSNETTEAVETETVKLANGVAATVNGVEIKEDDVTNAIENARYEYFYMYSYYFGEDLTEGLDDEEQWATYLEILDETPEEVRAEYLDQYIDEELILQYASERDVNISDETIDDQVAEMRNNYSTEEAWDNALSMLGITEADYWDEIKYQLTYQDVYDTFAVEPDEVTDADIIEYVVEYSDEYDGARRSSHVLFDIEDEATAQEVLNQIRAGEIDIATAAEEYSIDEGSAEEGGDVGWDVLTTFVDEYQEALDKLEKGEISDLVESEYGYHIIECTDIFYVDENATSTSDWPEEIVEDVKDMLESDFEYDAADEQEEDYQEWLEECYDKADIVIADMPEDVPYNVDLSLYADHFSTEDQEQLSELGFSEEDIEFLEEHYDDMINALGVASLTAINRSSLEFDSLYQEFMDDGYDEEVAEKMALFLTDPATFFSDTPESVTDEEIDEVWDTIDKLAEKDMVEEEVDESEASEAESEAAEASDTEGDEEVDIVEVEVSDEGSAESQTDTQEGDSASSTSDTSTSTSDSSTSDSSEESSTSDSSGNEDSSSSSSESSSN